MSFFEGRILRIKDQTAAISTSRVFKHPHFKKYIVRRSKTLAHIDLADMSKLNCEVGDLVILQRTRPISKMKSSKIVENKSKKLSVREVSE